MGRLLPMILLPFCLITPFNFWGQSANIFSVILTALTLFWPKTSKILLPLVFCLIIFQVFIFTDAKIIKQLSEPLGKEYTTDMRAFLKTYQLMESGQNFYPAFVAGMGGLRSGNFRPDISAWRQPFIFYLWSILPSDGQSIYYLWQIFLVLLLIGAYLITKNIFSPLLLWPYLHYSLVDLTILQPEWWGMAFLIFGLCLNIHKKYYLSGIFFVLSLMCRELFLIPIIFLTLSKFKHYFIFYVSFFVYYLFYHLPNIFTFPTEIFRSYANGDWRTLHSVFAYSSWNYLIGVYRPILVLFIISSGAILLRRLSHILIFSFLPFCVFTLLMAATGKIDTTRDYWSIYFIPMLLISIPVWILPPGKK